MADFDITVDTHPMAQSIDTINGNVRNVTTAVVAMETAVVLANEHAASKVCRNVDNGFFMLMNSQLSQKMAACASTISSKTMQMEKFRKDILRIQKVMTDDYMRIARRYTKHFNTLDKALEQRIHELDKAAMELGRLQHGMTGKLCGECSKAMVYSVDTNEIANKASQAQVKVRSSKAIGVMTDDISAKLHYNSKVNHILKEDTVEAKEEKYIPVVVVESESMFDKSNTVNNVYFSNEQKSGADKISNAVQEESSKFDWQEVTSEDYERIKTSFMNYCSSAGMQDRVASEVMRLFEGSKWQSANAGGGQE